MTLYYIQHGSYIAKGIDSYISTKLGCWYRSACKMAQREAIVVIVLTLSLHILFVLDLPSYLINAQYSVSQVIVTNVSVGISLLLFPLFGFLADLYLTRYRTIQMSLLILTSMIVCAHIGYQHCGGSSFGW